MKNRILRLTENLSLFALSLLLCLLAVPVQEVTFIENTVNVSTETSESNIPAWAWDKTWKRCEYEDSSNCVWNAKRDGDGGGNSFIHTSKHRLIQIEHYEAYRLTHHWIRLVYAP